MQAHQPSMILDLINEEMQGIFSLVDEIPYSVMLKIIGLNSVLRDQVNAEDKAALKEIIDKMGISEDSLKALDVLDRIYKLSTEVIFNAYRAVAEKEQKKEVMAADEEFPMLVELMQRNQGKNKEGLRKMKEFCDKLAVDIAKTEYGPSEIGQKLMMFLGATQYVLSVAESSNKKHQEGGDKDDDLELKSDQEKKKTIIEQEEQKKLNAKIAIMAKLPAKQRVMVPEIKGEQIVDLARQFTESDRNEVSRCYREICAALKTDDIVEVINLLAKLGKFSAHRDIEQHLLIGMPIDDMPPINLLVAINKLNEQYKIFSDPLLMDGCKAFKTLIGSDRFEKKAQVVPEIGLSYFEHVGEALFNWDKNRLVKVKFHQDPMLETLETAIQALKKEVDNFKNPFDRLRVVNLANKLHNSLDWYAHSTKKDKSAMLEMQNDFREIINDAGLLVQPLTFREKISHILLTVERMIKEKVSDKKESRYKFYSAKKQLADKLGVAEKLIKNIEPANDPIHPPTKASKR